MAPTTYADVLARNIRSARTRIDIGQDSLAARMRALGFDAWIRQTVSSTERGRRRPTAEEMLGLAYSLETTIARLMMPTEEDRQVEFPSGAAISVESVRLSVAGKIIHGILTWEGDTPVPASDVAEMPPVVRDAVNRMAEGRWPPAQKTQPVVAAIVTSAKGVLVTRRRDGKPPWGFVTGEIEPGELPEDAAVREVKEETSLEVRTGEVLGERDHPRLGRHLVYMAARPVRSTKVIVGDESELAEVKWVSLDEALQLLPDMFGPVREYLEREVR